MIRDLRVCWPDQRTRACLNAVEIANHEDKHLRQEKQAPVLIDSPAFGRFCIYRLISCLSWQLPWVLSPGMWVEERRSPLSPAPHPPPSSYHCMFCIHMPKEPRVLRHQLCLTCLDLLGFPVLIILFGLDGWWLKYSAVKYFWYLSLTLTHTFRFVWH